MLSRKAKHLTLAKEILPHSTALRAKGFAQNDIHHLICDRALATHRAPLAKAAAWIEIFTQTQDSTDFSDFLIMESSPVAGIDY